MSVWVPVVLISKQCRTCVRQGKSADWGRMNRMAQHNAPLAFLVLRAAPAPVAAVIPMVTRDEAI